MTASVNPTQKTVAIIGGGPAGLMAAEILIAHGAQVNLYDAMPTVGRKFLMAGKGGLNITHSEPNEALLSRYAESREHLEPMLRDFDANTLRQWVHALGIDTFIGSSGRVFPTDMKAAPLLRAWLHRLRTSGARFHMRHRWLGWQNHAHTENRFATPEGERIVHADATILALGGGSWARLGSDGLWVPTLRQSGVNVAPLLPSNCGFDVSWSEHFRSRFSGQPLTSVAIHYIDASGKLAQKIGQFVVTENGIEGSLIYAISAPLRNQISVDGYATCTLDLQPDWALQRVTDELSRPRGSRSMASHLQSKLNIKGVKAGLLRELVSAEDFSQPDRLAKTIKALPLRLNAARPIDEAISSAGGVTFDAVDTRLMIKALPGVFCAGEMLDWEAPTGGYLLSACFASGRTAGLGAANWLGINAKDS